MKREMKGTGVECSSLFADHPPGSPPVPPGPVRFNSSLCSKEEILGEGRDGGGFKGADVEKKETLQNPFLAGRLAER